MPASNTSNIQQELKKAIYKNLVLKCRVLTGLFSVIFLIQVAAIAYLVFFVENDTLTYLLNYKTILIGPAFFLLAALDEYYFGKLLARENEKSGSLLQKLAYGAIFVEITIPTAVLILAYKVLPIDSFYTPETLLNSPPVFVYFLFVILSALQLDRKMSIMAGLMAMVQYWALTVYFLDFSPSFEDVAFFMNIIKGFFLLVAGVISGLVSEKIKASVLESLKAREELIYELDTKVKEKTKEVVSQKTAIERQNIQLAEKNKNITDSIKYAKRIQDTILPPDSFVKEHLPDAFVLFKPKDIVSGDFYWVEACANHTAGGKADDGSRKVLFSAIDCTGHGVPGAFVSIVGHHGLSKAVHEFGLTKPAEILDKLNELVEASFARGEQEISDGMDMALCSFSKDRQESEFYGTLEYAGANNPLYIITDEEREYLESFRKLDGEGRFLYEIKPDKQPIGNYENKQSFTNHQIPVKKGDMAFVFSDGYADQFGGPKGKKLKYKPFKRLLLANANNPIQKQLKTIDRYFEEWRNGLEQVDDVCIIGVRL